MKQWEDYPLMLTVDEAAEILRLTKRTVSDMCREGRIPAFKSGKGRSAAWRIERDVLRRLVQEGIQDSNP